MPTSSPTSILINSIYINKPKNSTSDYAQHHVINVYVYVHHVYGYDDGDAWVVGSELKLEQYIYR